jgi:hypothetical protein
LPERRDGIFTVKIIRAAFIAVFILLAFLCGCFLITDSLCKDAGSVFHQELHHREVIAGGSAVQRRPEQAKRGQQMAEGGQQVHLPAIAVRSIHIAPELHKEFDNFEVAGADCIVQCRDAFVIRSAGVRNLQGKERSIHDRFC